MFAMLLGSRLSWLAISCLRFSSRLSHLREVRLIRLRNGAFSWRLHEDLGRPNTYRVEIMYPSWTEFLLMEERMTKSEREIINKARGYHVGDRPAEDRHFLSRLD
jgi:hypothetical protein